MTRARASAERASLETGTGRLDESLHVHRVSPGQVMLASDWLMLIILSSYWSASRPRLGVIHEWPLHSDSGHGPLLQVRKNMFQGMTCIMPPL